MEERVQHLAVPHRTDGLISNVDSSIVVACFAADMQTLVDLDGGYNADTAEVWLASPSDSLWPTKLKPQSCSSMIKTLTQKMLEGVGQDPLEACGQIKQYLQNPKYIFDDRALIDIIEAIGTICETLSTAVESGNDTAVEPSGQRLQLQHLNELFPHITHRLQMIATPLVGDCSARLFRSVRKLQPATNPSHNSLLKGLKSRLEVSLGSEPFSNQILSDCFGELKSFPNSEALKDVLVLLGYKAKENQLNAELRTKYLNCSQYAKVRYAHFLLLPHSQTQPKSQLLFCAIRLCIASSQSIE